MTALKAIKVLIGVLLMVLGLMTYAWWWPALWLVFKGLFGLFLAFVGLLVLLIGISD